MKQEASKKSKLWLWLTIGIVALLAVAGTVLALVLGGNQTKAAPDRPEIYWNLDKDQYFQKGDLSSTREKAEDGYFHISFAYNGEQKELLTSDKQLVNFIDTMYAMGLVFDNDGYIVDAVQVKDMATVVKEEVYVQKVESGKITANSSIVMNGMKTELVLCDKTGIYDVTTGAKVRGGEIAVEELQAMDKIYVYANAQNEITHVFVASHARASKVYWRANQFTSGGKTTREPDENGYYTIPFYCEGERVEFKCNNVTEVNFIDKQSRYSAHFGLVFDEEGYIEEAILSYEAIRGMIRSERFDVTGIDGNRISTTKIIGSNIGTTDSFTLGENCPIYDVSPAAIAEDRVGKPVDSLQIGDRIVCFADTEGNPLFVYVSERIVEDAVWCYSLGRKYDSTLKETTREPDADGWYVFEVFTGGQVLKVKTKDKAVATEIDAVGSLCFGLTLNGDEIVEVYTVYSVFGYGAFGQGRYITDITGSIFTCIKTSAVDKPITGILASGCKIYNLSEVGTYGEETKLQFGDYIYAYQDPNLQIVEIFVMRRKLDAPIYYSLTRKYDSQNKVTTREPDENGWYVYEVAVNGKVTTVKTQSKALATKMDSFSPAAMTLVVGNDGVVYEAYSGQVSTGGYRRASGYKVVSINSDGTVDTVYEKTGATRKLTLADYTKVYNVSQIFNKNRGEVTSLRVGDIITSFNDIYDKAAVIYVRTRQGGSLYWNTQRMYDDEKEVSTRVPDADGWYVYQLAVDGEVKTFKTQDKKIADQLDYYGGAFVINSTDGVITGVASPSYAKDSSGTNLLNYDVMKVEGNKVTLQYHVQGASKDGEIQTITLTSNVKIYDVSPTAENFGAATQLKVGDRIRTYKEESGDRFSYVFIRYRDTRKDGVDGYCEVCKKDVYWAPWMGGSFSTAGGHFYLNASMETENLPCSTGRSKTYPESKVCLDLNGNTYYRTKGRALYVYENATLNIMDCAGGGMILSAGINNGTSGGVLGIPGGTVNLYSGTLKLSDEHVPQNRAGVVYLTTGSSDNKTPGTFNMYGGTLTGGEVTDRGGNVCIAGGVFNLYDGVIENGKAANRGGNIVTMSNGIFNQYGGTVTGGTVTAGAGGNIYGGTGSVNIAGGTVSGGVSSEGGGNIYMLEALTVSGGTITGGTSQLKSGGNIYISAYSDNTSLTVTGGTITGGKCEGYGGNLYIEATPTISGAVISDGVSGKGGGNIYCGRGAVLTDTTITGGEAPSGGSITGSKDWTITGCTITGGEATDAKGSGGNINVLGGNWILKDSTISDGVSGARGGNIYASAAVVTMESGSITGGTSGSGNANGGGNVCTVSNACFVLNGGSVTNGTSVNTAGNILSGSGGLEVNGGVVSGGTAPNGGADIFVYGGATDVILSGGQLGQVEVNAAKTMVLSGVPEIEKLTMGSGVAAEVADLVAGAKIGLVAEGVFTQPLEAPESYIGYFEALEEGYSCYVEESALALGAGISSGYCSHCDTTVTWKQWGGKTGSGHYHLTQNEELSEVLTVGEGVDMILDLRGNTLSNPSNSVFQVNGNLTVLDSVSGGEIVGAGTGRGGVMRITSGTLELLGGTLRYAAEAAGASHGGVLYMDTGATANLKGGIVSGGKSLERGGNIYVNSNSVLNLSGATVTEGVSGTGNSNGGGNIFVLGGGLVNMTGGSVTNGTSVNTAGNILVGSGTLQISGGTVSGGNATGIGDNIYVYYNQSTAQISGGDIESVDYTDAVEFALSGNPKIGELTVADGKLVTLGDLTEGADITFNASGVFTTANENAQSFVDANYVKLTSKTLVVENNCLAVSTLPTGAKQAYCAHCDAEVVWYAWDGATEEDHYYLDADYEQHSTYGVVIPEGSTVVLDLCGYDVLGDKVRAFDISGDLTILDSVGGGEVVTGGVEENNSLGGVIRARKGSFTLLSGTLRLADDHSATIYRGGVIYIDKNCHVTIKGGTVANGVTTERGGNIFVVGGNTTAGGGLTVEGGLITNGTAGTGNSNGGGNIAVLTGSTVEIKGGAVTEGNSPKTAGNILATGNLTISGGEISGGKATGIAQNIYVLNNSGDVTVTGGTVESLTANKPMSLTVSGKPVIGELELMNGQKMTLGTLEEGADILVKANGIFTEANANAESYVAAGWIKGYDRFEITAENDQLSMAVAAESYCLHCEQIVSWSEWDGAAVDGHFYLAADHAPTSVINIAAGKQLVLDLCGYDVSNASSRTFYIYGELAILDCVGNGKVMGSQAGESMQGGVLRVRGGKFDLYGGTVCYNPEAAGAYQGGVIYAQAYNGTGATVNLHGGIVEGGKTSERGGNIFVNGAGTVVTLCGATVQGGHTGLDNNAAGGGNVFVMGGGLFRLTDGKILNGVADNYGGNLAVGSGNVLVEGGEISGGTATSGAANVYVYYNEGSFAISGGTVESITYKDAASFTLSGSPVIGELSVAAGKLVTLGELTDGADITVTGEGVFTTANANAAQFVTKGYIKATEGKQLTEEGGILSLTGAAVLKKLASFFGFL